jgi:hypothetical protein
MRAQAGCAARARSYLALTLFASSLESRAIAAPLAGLMTFNAIGVLVYGWFRGGGGSIHAGSRGALRLYRDRLWRKMAAPVRCF